MTVNEISSPVLDLLPGFQLDMKTAILGLLCLEFLLMGMQLLFSFLFRSDDYAEYEKKREKLELFERTYQSKHNFHDMPQLPRGHRSSNHLGV